MKYQTRTSSSSQSLSYDHLTVITHFQERLSMTSVIIRVAIPSVSINNLFEKRGPSKQAELERSNLNDIDLKTLLELKLRVLLKISSLPCSASKK